MELKAEDGDRMIELTVGDRLVVRLEANPGTGFRWQVEMSGPDVLLLAGSTFDPGEDDEGSPGQEVITLEAASSGATDVTFDYRRPWETDVEPEETITVQVTVAEATADRN